MKYLGYIMLFVTMQLTMLADGSKNMFITQADTAIRTYGINSIGNANSGAGANMNCPEYRRICIRIVNPATEKICFGFNKGSGGQQYFRVFDPLGGVALPGTALPTSGSGFISFYKQIFNGPSTAVGPGGYTPLIITPTIPGDYWVEFNANNFVSPTVTGAINIFDITVTKTTATLTSIVDGRVFCKQWNFKHAGSPTVAIYNGPIYAYTNDSVINKVTFNGIQGANWYLCMNNFGCTNATANNVNNRKSIIGDASATDTVADYKLFLSIPDTSTFKLTNVTTPTINFFNPVISPNCSNNGQWDSIYKFSLNSGVTGNINLTINLNGVPGYQAGTSDIALTASVSTGTNTISWNGYNGLGVFVSPGITIAVSGTIVLGETHLPLFDIENLPVGLTAKTILPVALINNPLLHFDDTNIPGGVSNILGCTAPCHNFNPIGNNNTINTWFYATELFAAQNFSLVAPVIANAFPTTSVNCFAACNASATLTHTMGIAPFSYSWTPVNQTNQTATNLCAGSYTAMVTDVNGCIAKSTLSVTQPTAINAVVSVTNNSNCTNPNGIAQVIASGGIPAYSYSWSPGTQTTATAVNLNSATYSVIIKDANNCTLTKTVSVNNPASPVITLSVSSNVICSGNSATLIPSGATVYSITASATNTFNSSFIVSNSVTTTYTIIGTNSTNCLSNSLIQTVSVNITPTVSMAAASPTVCNGNSTTINVTGANSYTLNPGALTGTVFVLSPTVSTQYFLTGQSSQNCVSSNTAILQITVNPNPTFSITASNTVLCSGQTTTINCTGANSYTIYPGGFTGSTFIANPTVSTQYTVIAASAQNCMALLPHFISILVNPTPTVNITSNTGNICSGQSVTLTATGANNYTLNPGNTIGNTFVLNPTGPTNYTLMGISNQNCLSAPANTFIVVNVTPTISVSGATTICAGQSATLSVSGANTYTLMPLNINALPFIVSPVSTSQYTIVGASAQNCISPDIIANITVNQTPTVSLATVNVTVCSGESVAITGQGASTYTLLPTGLTGINFSVTPLTSTQYTLIGVNAQGCLSSNNATAAITVKPTPTITIAASSNTLCAGGTLTLTANGATSYTWLPGNKNETMHVVTPNGSTTYNVIGSLNNCTTTVSKTIEPYSLPDATITASQNKGCAPLCSSFSLQPATNITLVNWLIGDSTSQQNNISHCFNTPGTQKINAKITDNHGCYNMVDYNVTVFQKPEADFLFSPGAPVINENSTVQFTDLTSNVPIVSWSWYFEDKTNETSNAQNPIHAYDEGGTYPVVMVVISDNNCADTIIKTITVEEKYQVFVPNAFTPNNDGTNDIFEPKGYGIKEYNLVIFDRWGTIIFESNDFLIGWDGNYKSEMAKEDVYTWRIIAKSVKGKTYNLTGNVTLYR